MLVPLTVIEINPFRDLNAFPIQEARKSKLKVSIGKTGFWDNVMVRPKNNAINGTVFTSQKQLDEYLKKNYPNGKPIDFPCELAYGHHRLFTLYDVNKDPEFATIDVLDIPVKFHTDDQMLQIMVHENRSDWGHDVSTMIESVGRVYDTILEQLDEFGMEDFEEFQKKYTYIGSSKQFKDAKGNLGVGFNIIDKYLGGEWDEKDIRGPLMAIKVSRDGLFDLKDCYSIKTGSALHETVKLIQTIHTRTIPKYFKDQWTNKVLQAHVDTESPPTVKALKTAITKTNQGYNPVDYLDNQKLTDASDPTKLIGDLLFEKNITTFDEAITIDGLLNDPAMDEGKDWSRHINDAIDLAVKKKEAIEKREQKKKEAEELAKQQQQQQGQQPDGSVPPPTNEDDPNLANLNAGDVTGSSGSAIQDISKINQMFAVDVPVAVQRVEALYGRADEIDENDDQFNTSVVSGFVAFTRLFFERFSTKEAVDLMDELLKEKIERDKAIEAAKESEPEAAKEPEPEAAKESEPEAAKEPEPEAAKEPEPEAAKPATKKAPAKGRQALLSKTAKKK